MRASRRIAVMLPAALIATGIAVGVEAKQAPEPDIVVVQHVLISFKGKLRNKDVERSKKEAQALGERLLERARAGEDFDALVKEYTDDAYPGIYTMTNRDAPRMAGAKPRDGMVPSFGDTAFGLAVGEIGLAAYSAGGSPYGWHLIKRLE